MIEIAIPGRATVRLEYLVLDLNGTIARDGVILPGVAGALAALTPAITPLLLTADTHGTAADICEHLGIELVRIPAGSETEAKAAEVRRLGASRVVAIGNGANDARMLAECAVGICVLGPEGAAPPAMQAADAIVTSTDAAFGLLLHPSRLVATLRV